MWKSATGYESLQEHNVSYFYVIVYKVNMQKLHYVATILLKTMSLKSVCRYTHSLSILSIMGGKVHVCEEG